jgi:aminoglycoside phosphotransferase (APT) family kinase protein
MADVVEVEVVVAHHERATLRVGDVFLKIDADQARTDRRGRGDGDGAGPDSGGPVAQAARARARRAPGTALGRLGEPSTATPRAWAAAGAAVRRLHDAPLPRGPGRASTRRQRASTASARGSRERASSRRPGHAQPPVAEAALRPWTPVFMHGDLQVAHVFVDGDEVTGVLDWSEAGQGDALYDLASLTLGHREHLGDVVAGYGTDVDLDVIRGWWSLRSLTAVRWLVEHGFDPAAPGCEIDVLRAQL